MAGFFKKLFNLGEGLSHDLADQAIAANASTVGRQLIRKTDESLEKARKEILKVSSQVELIKADITDIESMINQYTEAAKTHNNNGDVTKAIKCAEKVQEYKDELETLQDRLQTAQSNEIALKAAYDKATEHRDQQDAELKAASADIAVSQVVRNVTETINDLNSSNTSSTVGKLKEISKQSKAETQVMLNQLNEEDDDLLKTAEQSSKLSGQAALDALLNK